MDCCHYLHHWLARGDRGLEPHLLIVTVSEALTMGAQSVAARRIKPSGRCPYSTGGGKRHAILTVVPAPGIRMRRALVIFLILLFPLNVFAVSISAAPVQQSAGTTEHVNSSADSHSTGTADWESKGDIDADEPPASSDFHDSMNERIRLRFPVLPARAILPYAPSVYIHPSFPPIKPPPVVRSNPSSPILKSA